MKTQVRLRAKAPRSNLAGVEKRAHKTEQQESKLRVHVYAHVFVYVCLSLHPSVPELPLQMSVCEAEVLSPLPRKALLHPPPEVGCAFVQNSVVLTRKQPLFSVTRQPPGIPQADQS